MNKRSMVDYNQHMCSFNVRGDKSIARGKVMRS